MDISYLSQSSVGRYRPDIELEIFCQRQPEAPATVPEGEPEGNALPPSFKSFNTLGGTC